MLRQKPILKTGEDARDLPTYTIPEGAAYLGIPKRTLRSWFLGKSRIFDPEFRIGDIPLLSFRDLIDAHIVQAARVHHNVPMQRIRSAIVTAKGKGDIKHPLQNDNIRIFARCLIEVEQQGKKIHSAVNLSKHGQSLIPGVVEQYTRRILRDREGNMIGLFPSRSLGNDNRFRPVAIYPDIMSGRLIVTDTRVPVTLLVAEHRAGKSVRRLSRDFRIPIRRIEEALSHLDTKAA